MAEPRRAQPVEAVTGPRPRRALDQVPIATARRAAEVADERPQAPVTRPSRALDVADSTETIDTVDLLAAEPHASRHRARRLVLAATVTSIAVLGATRPAPASAPTFSDAPVATASASGTPSATAAPPARSPRPVTRASERPSLDPAVLAARQQAARKAAKLKAAQLKAAQLKAAELKAAQLRVLGIPQPCETTHEYPLEASPAQVRQQLQAWSGLKLTGPEWTKPNNRMIVRMVWQTLDGLGCTNYLATIKSAHPGFGLHAGPTRSWAWGDWGLTHHGVVTLDFAKWRTVQDDDPGRLVRILVHELGHAWSQTPGSQDVYNSFGSRYAQLGNFGPYAYSKNENFSEVIGYYVARCAKDNPYDKAKYAPYYEYVKKNVFAGREFGPAPGTKASCA